VTLSSVKKARPKTQKKMCKLTFEMLGTADELDAREQRDSAWQKHGEAAHLHVAFLTGCGSGLVPSDKWPAARCIVDVIEEAALGYEKCVRLEGTLCGRK
jgi:hypothetical protein